MIQRKILLALLGACVMFGLYPGRAGAVSLDCDALPDGAIQAALDAGETLIEFEGFCDEFVEINQDGTVIRGMVNPSTDIIRQGLSVNGATRVLVENLTINGIPAGFVSIANGAFATFRNTTIVDTDHGFFVSRGSSVRLQGNTFGPANVDDGNLSCNPICIFDNSHARLEDNTITGDTNDPFIGGALTVFRDASVVMRGGNEVENDGSEPAIGVANFSSFRQDNFRDVEPDEINGGIVAENMSHLTIREAVVTGDVTVDLHSLFELGNKPGGGDPGPNEVTGNITVSRDSALSVGFLVTINGDVTCLDDESSLSGTFDQPANFKTSCTGFSAEDEKGGGGNPNKP